MDRTMLLDLLRRGSAFDKPIAITPLSPCQRHSLAVELQQVREYRRTQNVQRPIYSKWQIRKMKEYADSCMQNDASLAALGEE